VSVYVDDMYKHEIGEFSRMKMSHMVADSHAELLAMADTIGVARRWIQYPGTDREHFDICMSKRAKAVAAGAVEITMRELALRRVKNRNARTATDTVGTKSAIDRKDVGKNVLDVP
jgi:hypothetical protein